MFELYTPTTAVSESSSSCTNSKDFFTGGVIRLHFKGKSPKGILKRVHSSRFPPAIMDMEESLDLKVWTKLKQTDIRHFAEETKSRGLSIFVERQ